MKIPYTRDELLNIRATLSPGCHPDFQGFHSDILRNSTDCSLNKHANTRNRAGWRLRLEKKRFRAPLPGLVLANVRSKAALTHGLTWAETPGTTTIRGPVTSCRIKTRRERGTNSPPPNTCTLLRLPRPGTTGDTLQTLLLT